MRGRTPSGPESVEQLPGSDKAKQRVRVILQTMTGELRVQEACAQLERLRTAHPPIADGDARGGHRQRRRQSPRPSGAPRGSERGHGLARSSCRARAAVAGSPAQRRNRGGPAARGRGAGADSASKKTPPSEEQTLAPAAADTLPQAAPAASPPAADQPAADPHLQLLQQCLQLTKGAAEDPLRRGRPQPSALQRVQQQVREHVVDYVERLQEAGLTQAQCGALLQLSPRTLRYWTEEHCGATFRPAPLGRPLTCAPLPVRQQILADLKLLGTGVGVPTLQQHFPEVSRAELASLLDRFRTLCRRRDRQPARVLHWQTPGRVWAADFTEPSCRGGAVLPPIAERYPYVLAVRDLASGMMLAWEPLPSLTTEVTQAALARLFALHGAPLILKVDNGSAFRAQAFQDFLQAADVIPLYSPPSCPGYNGAIEAAIGSLKKRTAEHAEEQGHAGRWDVADLEVARTAANASHPRRLNGRMPSTLWDGAHADWNAGASDLRADRAPAALPGPGRPGDRPGRAVRPLAQQRRGSSSAGTCSR